MDDSIFYTRTMAKVLTDQGKLSEALDVYRYLLEKEPDQQDLQSLLEDIEKQLHAKGSEKATALFEAWVDCIFTYKKIRQLKQLQRRLNTLGAEAANIMLKKVNE